MKSRVNNREMSWSKPDYVFVFLRNCRGMIHVKGSEMTSLEYHVAGKVDNFEDVMMYSCFLCF